MNDSQLLHAGVSEIVIACFYEVYNELGHGFLERVYENAMSLILAERGLQVSRQMPVDVYFRGVPVGTYFADLVINQCVIVEIKSVEALHPAHEAQLVNYLRATQLEVGLLLNFGVKPQLKRKIFTNDRKPRFLGNPGGE